MNTEYHTELKQYSAENKELWNMLQLHLIYPGETIFLCL